MTPRQNLEDLIRKLWSNITPTAALEYYRAGATPVETACGLLDAIEAAGRESMRDKFAMAAVPSLAYHLAPNDAAQLVYQVADAMIEARKQGA